MKLLIERDDGSKAEVREIESVPADADVVIFFSPFTWRAVDIEAVEDYLTKKIGKKCVVVDSAIQKVVGVKAWQLKSETGRL